ncbi:MAG: hypothetical protein ACTSX8_03560 [Alphaproteobacteria bacterium]
MKRHGQVVVTGCAAVIVSAILGMLFAPPWFSGVWLASVLVFCKFISYRKTKMDERLALNETTYRLGGY